MVNSNRFNIGEMETKDANSLQIITHKTNPRSCKIPKKSRFLWKLTLINEFTPLNGKPMNMELYELFL